MPTRIRIGLIGAGKNTRERHIPGLLAEPDVEIVAVCNRRPESTAAVAREYNIPQTFARWQDLLFAPEIDAIVIGTWPYLHGPITFGALATGKHVLTEARMCLNADEARAMLKATEYFPNLVAQIVPSPFGLTGDAAMRECLAPDVLGELREYYVYSLNGSLADPYAPLHWRQDAELSGLNVLTLGILHETVSRWLPQPVRVLAQSHAFTATRFDPAGGIHREVGTPDSVQALTQLPNGARGVYQFSGVVPFGGGSGACFCGTKATVHYDFTTDRISATRGGPLDEIAIPPATARGWRVEADFIQSIRDGTPVRLTDFASGVAYMEFTEAVAQSAESGAAVDLTEANV